MKKVVYVGMSGGVDSSVTAALLKEQGYTVVGVYMKNWSRDLPGHHCPWKDDYQDAMRVAVQLGIEFRLYDFEREYRRQVVDYMIEEYKAGRTPNPDIMCNQEVKFKLFLRMALDDGADLMATGHYAQIRKQELGTKERATGRGGRGAAYELWAGKDTNKDQSYFLYRVNEEALRRSLMPVGVYRKTEVRQLAKKMGLATADKKDSQGICFVGKVGIKEFLQQYVKSEPGAIIDRQGRVIGEHDGAMFYTIGQRHGLNVGGGLPYYVTGKDMGRNEVYVTTDLDDSGLWRDELELTGVHWINGSPDRMDGYAVRMRYRSALVGVSWQKSGKNITLSLKEPVRAVTPGQSAVLYDGERVMGGGVVV